MIEQQRVDSISHVFESVIDALKNTASRIAATAAIVRRRSIETHTKSPTQIYPGIILRRSIFESSEMVQFRTGDGGLIEVGSADYLELKGKLFLAAELSERTNNLRQLYS